jgi:CheY-like chemotaxis protein
MSVLVVDDSPEIASLLARWFRADGFTVRIASNGEEALAAARADRPDLIVLDLAMPRMNGFQVLEAIRDDEHLALTPVVVLTGLQHGANLQRCRELGADEILLKPASLCLLSQKVRHILTLRQRAVVIDFPARPSAEASA